MSHVITSIPLRTTMQILRGVELFEMLPEGELRQLATAGEIEDLGPGQMLFDAGDPADRLHVVIDGALEILRATPDHHDRVPVAYLAGGEAIGTVALLTGSRRESGCRAPERAQVWTLTRTAFEKFANRRSGYWRTIAKVFARRHETMARQERRPGLRKELAGRLKFFDMPTVVQTLVSTRQTGILGVVDDTGKVFAEVLLRHGSIERARARALEGENAFYEIFLAELDGQFYFRSVVDPDANAVSRVPIRPSAMTLLMQAVRLLDELPAARARLPDPGKAYLTQVSELNWDDAQTLGAARAIFDHLQTPRKLETLAGRVPCNSLTLYQIAARLHSTGQIG